MIARHANVETAERMVEEILSSGGIVKKARRGRARGMLRDVRVFYNSVDRAVELLRRCGVRAETEKREEDASTVFIIRIPKSG